MAPRGHPDPPAEHQAASPALNQAVEKPKEAGGQHLLYPSPRGRPAAAKLPICLRSRPVGVITPRPRKQAARLEFPPWQPALL